jgi:hypothetical protein
MNKPKIKSTVYPDKPFNTLNEWMMYIKRLLDAKPISKP